MLALPAATRGYETRHRRTPCTGLVTAARAAPLHSPLTEAAGGPCGGGAPYAGGAGGSAGGGGS